MRTITKLIRAICETILSWLPPDNRLAGDIPMLVAWDPATTHFCLYCTWVKLVRDSDSWYCTQCGATFQSLADTDPIAAALPPSDLEITTPRKAIAPPLPYVEKSPIGELSRKVHLGKITLHGIDGAWLQELQWADTGERVNTSELPAIGSWRYTQGE